MDVKTYRSRVDAWIAIILGIVAAACLSSGIGMIVKGMPGGVIMAPIIIFTGVILPFWLMLTTRYVLGSDTLEIRSDPIKWEVPLKEIRKITPSRSILSSPAFSLDRLEIQYGRWNSILISPAQRDDLLRELETRRAAVASSSGRMNL